MICIGRRGQRPPMESAVRTFDRIRAIQIARAAAGGAKTKQCQFVQVCVVFVQVCAGSMRVWGEDGRIHASD